MDLDEIYREIEQEFDVSLRRNSNTKKEWQDYWAWLVKTINYKKNDFNYNYNCFVYKCIEVVINVFSKP